MKYILVALFVLTVFFAYSAYATSFGVDKSSYQQGDDILLTGYVSPMQPGAFVSIQILNPSSSDLVQVDMFLPNSDGSFSKMYKADGQKWASSGVYTLKLFYNNEEHQTTFQYNNIVEPKDTPKPVKTTPKTEVSSKPGEEKSELNVPLTTESKQKPKTHVPGFPSLDKSPHYYIDRYERESSYKEWFDSQFPGKLIEEVVGYKSTHIIDFPDEEKSPAYYIDRYERESSYKEWFDSQFPGKSVYQILGFPDPIPVPEWIKNNAEWWSRGQISDDDFVSGIQYMIENNIIVIPNIPDIINADSQEVPDWVRNNASWWALDKISEEEFLNAIKYLIENGVIPVSQ